MRRATIASAGHGTFGLPDNEKRCTSPCPSSHSVGAVSGGATASGGAEGAKYEDVASELLLRAARADSNGEGNPPAKPTPFAICAITSSVAKKSSIALEVRPRCGESCEANSLSSRGVSSEPSKLDALKKPKLVALLGGAAAEYNGIDGAPLVPAPSPLLALTSLRSVAPCGRFVRNLDLDADLEGTAVEMVEAGGGMAVWGTV